MKENADFDYSLLSNLGAADAVVMLVPLQCWGRGKPNVPLEDNPLVQWVKEHLLDLEPHANDAPYGQASRGMGRGRPVRVDQLLVSAGLIRRRGHRRTR